jgi:hypothetical protein
MVQSLKITLMKKQILLVMVSLFAVSLSAQLYLNETFNYSTSILASRPGDPPANADNPQVGVWFNTGKTADSNSASLAIDGEPLYYTGYMNSGAGKSVRIDWGGAGANTRVDVVRFIAHDQKVSGVGKKLYYAFMMNIENIQSFSAGADNYDWRDVLCVTEGGNDILGNSFRGRFFLKQDPEDPSKVKYSISKNTAFTSAVLPDAEGEIAVGQTYLFVIRQTFTGDATCKVEVMHNPEIAANEPESGWINGKTSDVNTFGGTYGVALRRRNLGSNAKMFVSGLRVAATYGEAVGFTSGISTPAEAKIYADNKTIVTPVEGNIRVYSLTGAELINATSNGRYNSQLSAGMYLVHFTDQSGAVSSAKLMIQ